MPFLLLIFAGTAIAGWACAYDEGEKREQDARRAEEFVRGQAKNHERASTELQGLRQRVVELESNLAEAKKSQVSLSSTVVPLCDEIARLRVRIAELEGQGVH